MGETFYKIELRQFEVGPTNARHYFWVLKDETGKVIGEMHGQPANRPTGRPASGSDSRWAGTG